MALVLPISLLHIPSRSIHETIVVVNEMIHNMNKLKGNKFFFALKIDLTKAYDIMSWVFIVKVLKEVGVLEKLLYIIWESIS